MADNLNVVSYRDFVDPQAKDKDWILKAVQDNYYFGGANSLLHGKNVREIQSYAAGKHSMKKFWDMFPTSKKRAATANPDVPDGVRDDLANAMMDRKSFKNLGMDIEPLGILQQPLSSALATLQKQLTYISFRAVDALANDRRKKDMDILENRNEFMKNLAPATQLLRVPLQPPQTQFNTPTVDPSSMGLDPSKKDQLNIYADLFYKLKPETAFEVLTESLMDLSNFKMKKDLEKRDQLYYGVSSNRSYFSDITDIPSYDYVFPGNVYTPASELPDFSDQPFRYISEYYNVEKLLQCVGKTEFELEYIRPIFEGYWASIGLKGQQSKWDTAPESQKRRGVPVVYMEFKSFDVLRVARKRTANGRMHSEVVPWTYKLNSTKKDDPNDTIKNKWPEQTYFAYWIPGTENILKSGKVPGLFRAKGRENKSRFTIGIFKSKEKSDVEQCMTKVDDAQRAYIKLQLAVVMSKPNGVYIDMKYIRNAVENFQKDMAIDTEDLVNLFFVKNVMIGDTEAMDGANDGNYPPFRAIPGGMGAEAREYLAIIADCVQFIARLTGWNDALTGQTPTNDALVGIQKLMLNASQNSLHYAVQATKQLTRGTVETWAPMIQYICERKNKMSEARRYLENIVGQSKIQIINSMDNLSVHEFGLIVDDAPDEEAQAELKQILFSMLEGGRIDLSDYFIVKRVMNYKDAEGLLVLKEKQKKGELLEQQQRQQEAIQQAAQIRVQGDLQKTTIQAQGVLQSTQMKGQVDQTIEDMRDRLAVLLKQMDQNIELQKKNMQGEQQSDKIQQKHNLDLLNTNR